MINISVGRIHAYALISWRKGDFWNDVWDRVSVHLLLRLFQESVAV